MPPYHVSKLLEVTEGALPRLKFVEILALNIRVPAEPVFRSFGPPFTHEATRSPEPVMHFAQPYVFVGVADVGDWWIRAIVPSPAGVGWTYGLIGDSEHRST